MQQLNEKQNLRVYRNQIGVDEQGKRRKEDLKSEITNDIRIEDFSQPNVYYQYLKGEVFTHRHLTEAQRKKLL